MTILQSLPIIDPTSYLPHTHLLPSVSLSTSNNRPSRSETANAIHRACRDVGFFYLRVDSFLSPEECNEVVDSGREFFKRPQEEKELIRLEESDGVRGYQRLHQNITKGKADHHEALDLYAPWPSSSSPPTASESMTDSSESPKTTLAPLRGPNQYPSNPASMRHTLERWTEKMKILGEAVMHAMADGLGLDDKEWKDLWGLVNDSFWVMRVIGYPPLPPGAEGISCGEHKDYGCLTFLLADPIPSSLQVLSTSSTWLSADPLPGCLVVNIGEMWSIWSRGLYPATLHRVIHTSPTYRVSVPFFFEPNYHARVKGLEGARRKCLEEGREEVDGGEVMYGDFLLGKVSGNFKY
ncbi:Clavaminate synthase-like protein [Naematelia encephala]|uniref:Clavaminate synthase-like protein n=1 Tax=Naematelia encephala TaxID=71784 RepID=A0A1Y2B0Z1_9TREE|nr:Clavaminate synthase-like protein [Naematelia encephala]